MPGYSGTPLAKKLGIKDGQRLYFVELPAEVRMELKSALTSCAESPDGKLSIDFAMLFTKSKSELAKEFRVVAERLNPAGMLWVSWPKKSSGWRRI